MAARPRARSRREARAARARRTAPADLSGRPPARQAGAGRNAIAPRNLDRVSVEPCVPGAGTRASWDGNGWSAPHQKRHDQEDERDGDEHVSELRRHAGDTAIAEDGGDERNHEENECPVEHRSSSFQDSEGAIAVPLGLPESPPVPTAVPDLVPPSGEQSVETTRHFPTPAPGRLALRSIDNATRTATFPTPEGLATLSDEQRDAFRERGYFVLGRPFDDAALTALRTAYDAAL